MKKIILSIFAGFLIVFTGCKSIPTADKMYITSYAVGAASAEVLETTKISDKTANIIVKTLNSVQLYIPATNETFTGKWLPIVSVNVNTMIKNNEFSTAEGQIVNKSFELICKGLDYIIEQRYPQAKQYNDLMSSAVYGFSSGFLSYFNPNKMIMTKFKSRSLDEDEYLKALKYLENCKN